LIIPKYLQSLGGGIPGYLDPDSGGGGIPGLLEVGVNLLIL